MSRPHTAFCTPKRQVLPTLTGAVGISRTELSTEAHTPSIFEHIEVPQEPSQSFIRSLAKLTQTQKDTMKSIEAHLTVLEERIEMQQDEIKMNQESIDKLYAWIERYSEKQTEINNGGVSNTNSCETKKVLAQITENTAEEFLKTNPLIVEALLTPKYTEKVTDILTHLPKHQIPTILKSLRDQLERVQLCFGAFNTLSKLWEEPIFYDTLQECIKTIFESREVYIYIFNDETGYYESEISKGIKIIVQTNKSLIAHAIETGKPFSIRDPTKSEYYCSEVDDIFNSKLRPILIIPFGHIAVASIISTDESRATFKAEDEAIGRLFSRIIFPVIRKNQNRMVIQRAVERRKLLEDFEGRLLEIDRFEDLIPFLDRELEALVDSRECRVLFVSAHDFYVLEQTDGRMLPRNIRFSGVGNKIRERKEYAMIESFSVSEPGDEEIDGWAEGFPFLGFPIEGSSREVLAILCISGTRVFNEKDIEMILSACSPLSLSVQRCIENNDRASLENAVNDLGKLPSYISLLKFGTSENSEKPSKLRERVMNIFENLLQAEYLEIFYEENDRIERIYGTKSAVTERYVRQVINNRKTVISSVVDNIEGFEKVDGIEYRSVFASTAEDNENHRSIAAFAINSKLIPGPLHESHEAIVKVGSLFYFILNNMENDSLIYEERRRSLDELESGINILTATMNSKDIPRTMLTNVMELMKADLYIVYYRNLFDSKFEAIISTEDINNLDLNMDDPIVMETINEHYRKPIESKNFINSKLKSLQVMEGRRAIIFPLNDESFIIFAGTNMEVKENIEIIFQPILFGTIETLQKTDQRIRQLKHSNSLYGSDFDDISLGYCLDPNEDIEKAAVSLLLKIGFSETLEIPKSKAALFVHYTKKCYRGCFRQGFDALQFAVGLMSEYCKDLTDAERVSIGASSLFAPLGDSRDDFINSQCIYSGSSVEEKDRTRRRIRCLEAAVKAGIEQVRFFEIVSSSFSGIGAEEESERKAPVGAAVTLLCGHSSALRPGRRNPPGAKQAQEAVEQAARVHQPFARLTEVLRANACPCD